MGGKNYTSENHGRHGPTWDDQKQQSGTDAMQVSCSKLKHLGDGSTAVDVLLTRLIHLLLSGPHLWLSCRNRVYNNIIKYFKDRLHDCDLYCGAGLMLKKIYKTEEVLL